MRTAKKNYTDGRHIGFGKVILLGEHFVVHGARAVVAGISEFTQCWLQLTPGVPGFTVDDERPAIPGYVSEKRGEQRTAHRLVLEHLQIDVSTDGLHAVLGGPLSPSSGIGASAADVVSLSRALNEMCGLNLSEAGVNRSAYAGECGYHGTPSGVDNTAATYGGLLEFHREKKGSKFKRVMCQIELPLIVIGTGITQSTTNVVADVRAIKAKDEAQFAALVEQYNELFADAVAALIRSDLPAVGAALNRNHSLLQKLTVSCKELDRIVDCCMGLGALGAKMSGTGRGGIAVALCRSREAQKEVAEGLRRDCPEAKFVWCYSVAPVVINPLESKL